VVVSCALAATVFGARAAGAAGATDRILTGGFSGGNAESTMWSAPGLSTVYGNNFPNTGQGESSAQMRMPEGVLRRLRVSLKNRNQTSGTVTVMVRINGQNTVLQCSVATVGNCGTAADLQVPISAGDLLAIRIDNNLVNEDGVLLTYTLQFE
jgi:hypothetical protein